MYALKFLAFSEIKDEHNIVKLNSKSEFLDGIMEVTNTRVTNGPTQEIQFKSSENFQFSSVT